MVTRRFWPPETPRVCASPIIVFPHSDRPRTAIMSSTAVAAAATAAAGAPGGSGATAVACVNASVSRTVSSGKCTSTCGA